MQMQTTPNNMVLGVLADMTRINWQENTGCAVSRKWPLSVIEQNSYQLDFCTLNP